MAVRTCLTCAAFLLVLGACADSAPIPGYENVGGADGSGGMSSASNTVGTGSTTSGNTTSSSNTSSSTTSSSTTTSSTTSTTTSSTTSTGLMCMDDGPGEPNDTESTAHDLGTIGDADGNGDMVSGVLAGVADVDWYKFTGQDNLGAVVDPTRTVTAGVRICKFLQCTSGNTTFTCPSSTMPETSPDGRAGCCGSTGFSIDDLDCTGTASDNAVVYVRLDTQTNICKDYTYAYHY